MRELGRFSPEINKVMKMPLEFSPQAVQFLTSLFEGLCYMATLRLMEDNPAVKKDQLASLEREIGKWFFVCRNIAKQNSSIKNKMKAYLPDLMFNYYWHTYQALARMASLYGEKHEAEVTKGFIGIQCGYLREMKLLMKTLEKQDHITKEGKNMLKEAWKSAEPLANEVEQKIREIYKCEVPQGEQLTFIEEWQSKIPDMEPKNIRVPPEDAQYFA